MKKQDTPQELQEVIDALKYDISELHRLLQNHHPKSRKYKGIQNSIERMQREVGYLEKVFEFQEFTTVKKYYDDDESSDKKPPEFDGEVSAQEVRSSILDSYRPKPNVARKEADLKSSRTPARRYLN